MRNHSFASLDPIDPNVRAQARQLADQLARFAISDTQVCPVVREMLDDIAQGGRVVLLRADEDVTIERAADMLGETRQFVDRLLASGALSFHRLLGKDRCVKISDVLALAAEREKRQAGHEALRATFSDAGLLDNA